MKDYLTDFVSRKAAAGVTEIPPDFKTLLVEARAYRDALPAQNKLAGEMDQVTGFALDLEGGQLTLNFTDRDDLVVEAQVVGTYSDDGSFMWGWGHPSVPQPMQQAAWAAQRYGDRQLIDELLSRGGEATQDLVDDYIAITAYLAHADGIFSGDHGGGGQVCILWFLAYKD